MSGIYYAIGGANYAIKESLEIDLDILNEARKINYIGHKRNDTPNVLYVGAALDDDKKQINLFKSYYTELGFNVNLLYSYKKNITKEEIELFFNENDVIYFGGGMTSKLINFVKKYDLKELIINSFNNNKIIAGVSAGAIMLFSYGFGDRESFVDNFISVNHKMTEGINIFSTTFCPHYQNSSGIFYHDEVKKYNVNGFAVENGASLKIKNNNFTVIKSKNSNVFMFDKTNNYKLVHLKNDIVYDINLLR